MAELEGSVLATVLGADSGAIKHMAGFKLDQSYTRWRRQREHERAAAQQDFSVAKIMEKYKIRTAVAGWRRAIGLMAEAKEAARKEDDAGHAWEAHRLKYYLIDRGWRSTAARARHIKPCNVYECTRWKHTPGVERCEARVEERVATISEA